MLIYEGTEVEHWREPFEGTLQVQAFLHFVRSAGRHAHLRYDGRAALCQPARSLTKAQAQAWLDGLEDPADLMERLRGAG
jgi:hypothetical protein